jgi:tRNA(Ile2) C34 agmatinyltransferase TiaS
MKDFKKLSMYDENIKTTASNNSTPLLGLDNVSVAKRTVCPLCGSKTDKHGWDSGGYRCPNGFKQTER